MDARIYRRFCSIAQAKAGIDLGDSKQALVGSRVARRLRALHLSNPQEYLDFLESHPEEVKHFVDAISTNVTSFFRGKNQFEALSSLVEQWVEREQRGRLRFWSAACSSGEEPYSMAITIAEALKGAKVDFLILATDINTRMLAAARAGVYPAADVEGIPQRQRAKYFHRHRDRTSTEVTYEVKSELKDRIVFKHLNLATPPFPMNGPIDVVFCRNVMIYFDLPVRQRLVAAIGSLLADDGVLVTGQSESLVSLKTDLRMIQPSVYGKRRGAARAC